MTEQHSPTRRFWLGGKRAAEQDRFFREALEPRGWQLGDEHDWDAGWITGMPNAAQFRRVSPRRKMNHFPGNAALTVKSRLHDSLATLRERMHESHGPDHELVRRLAFFPRAYVMPDDYHALQEAAQADPGQRWILKPTNASKGKGVRVLKDTAEAPLAKDWLVQEYLANPHTIRGHKYVLRLYVLITSLAPLRVYLYHQGFAKLASEPWDPEDADNPYSQLTNPDINALNSRAEVPVEFIDLERYRQWLRDQGQDDAALFARIEDLVALTTISAVDAMRQRTAEAGADPRGCYELLGLDCLVDDTLKPWILECNLSPSLGICAAPETGGRVEEAVKGGLVHDMVSLVDIPGEADVAAEGADDAARLVADAEAEQARAGGFRRLLPAAEPERYLPYFTLPTRADWRLAEALAGRSLPALQLQRRHVAELVDEERLALYDTRSGRYYRPNDTAALTWLLATEGLDPDAIADELARATREAGGAVEPSALRRDVWNTLHDWCRAGLLCQQGDGAAALPSEDERHAQVLPPVSVPGRAMRLSLDGRHWSLEVGSDPALARLSAWFGERLSSLDDKAVNRLPRLAVLRESGGYALASDDRLLASRLTLAQLGPMLTAHLIRQAATPSHPVVDAALLVTPQGEGVLCLLPDEEDSHALLVRLQDASGGMLTRGVRLDLSNPAVAKPLDAPLRGVSAEAPTGLPAAVALRGMLLPAEASAEEPLAPVAMLEALGALLPNCLSGDDRALDAHSVSVLSDWLATLGAFAIRTGPDAPDAASLTEWLVSQTVTAPAVDPPAMVRG